MAVSHAERQEIDCINLLPQNEKLRHALQDQKNEQVATLFSYLEPKSMRLIRQKDEDLAQATRKTIELEDHLKNAEIESEAWQRLAKENEAMVEKLSNTLEQVRERMVMVSNRGEDTESCYVPCERGDEKEEEMESQRKRMACKSCNSRSSCLVFLPCRHLCCCYFCEALLDVCPVCKSAKEDSIEVFLS
ncbi:hypothetical protein L6164_024884 [Bauhinia variegata]|uniref:Uncharacterized protein n=1 Tax=Bauhinia variegata TaxID=167791 RepID=A0ACB9LYU7_BAUVA|nr:hypothetical protein L6164_024884 [Bauhinia variegata]